MNALARFIGSGAYTGYAPVASGTFGTLPGMLLAIPLARLAQTTTIGYVAVVVVAIAIAIWSADRCAHIFESGDPSQVVADEIVGFFLTVAFIQPLDAKTLILGFFLFRFFDIAKTWPADAAEALPGGYGIVIDDLVAGVYANLSLRLLLVILARLGFS